MKNRKKLPRISSSKPRILTKENFVSIFEDIKDLIHSTAKATQTVLKKEMNEKFDITWAAITEHSRLIKGLDVKIDSVREDLTNEIKGVRIELTNKIDGVRVDLTNKIEDVRIELKEEIQGVRTELKEEMHSMEKRLSDKIDAQSARLDNHDSRITVLEQGT